MLNYRIIIQQANNDYFVFPGDHKGNPFAWDNFITDEWQTFVAAENSKLEIFNPTTDRNFKTYPQFQRGFQINYITGTEPGQLILRLTANELSGDHTLGFQYYFSDKLNGRESETFDKMLLRARAGETAPLNAKITLVNKDGFSFSIILTLTNDFQDIDVPLNNLKSDSELLLPRPYPGFLPLWFRASGNSSFNLKDIEKIQVTIGTDISCNRI